MLRDLVVHVIGVDTAKNVHAAVVVDAASTAQFGEALELRANRAGYEAVLAWADEETEPTERAWAIESTGSYGAGLVRFLQAAGEWVIEINRTDRRRGESKSDPEDALKIARAALSRDKLAEPRCHGDREAVRVVVVSRDNAVRCRTRSINLLKDLVVAAPDEMREQLRGHRGTPGLLKACRALLGGRDREWDTTVTTLQAVAARIDALDAEIADYDDQLDELTKELAPQLRAETGIGPVGSAKMLISWSHQGRCRSEAAYANLGGASPLEASSGQTKRHRLNRGGDRQLNRALHTAILVRLRQGHPATIAYRDRRISDGKTPREIKRCLKRYLARHIYRLLEHRTPVAVGGAGQ